MPSPKAVERIAIVTHNHEPRVADAVARVERLAEAKGVEVTGEDGRPDLAVTLGGDGSMLRAFHRFLGTDVPVIGVNFGRVGFLTSIQADELETGLERAFVGDVPAVRFPALVVRIGGRNRRAVIGGCATSISVGRVGGRGCY